MYKKVKMVVHMKYLRCLVLFGICSLLYLFNDDIVNAASQVTLSEYSIVEKDSQGYVIKCKAAASSGINRVQCPTWTDKNSQDDLVGSWETNTAIRATKSGDYYYFRVNISDHNNELGVYISHVYAYDNLGNSNCVSMSVCLQDGATPQRFIRYKDSLYSVFEETMNWTDLNNLCASMGSKLASVESADKNQILWDLTKGLYRTYYYLGGYQKYKGDAWHWLSGNAFQYTNWVGAQPDCAGGNEFYLSISPSEGGKWNDINSNQSNTGFLVETPLNFEPVTTIETDDKVYKFYNEALPFWLAEKYCEENGGRLAISNSAKVNEMLVKKVKQLKHHYYLGATDEAKEGTWKWVDNTAVTYTYWADNEPNNIAPTSGPQNYLIIAMSGVWDDAVPQNSGIGFIGEFAKKNDTSTTQNNNISVVTNTQNSNTTVITKQVAALLNMKKGYTFYSGNLKCKVSSVKSTKGTVSIIGVKSKKMKSITIPDVINKNGVSLKVTTIGAKAFKNCKKLRKITIKATSLKSIGKKALSGLSKKLVVKVPKGKAKKYGKMVQKAKK